MVGVFNVWRIMRLTRLTGFRIMRIELRAGPIYFSWLLAGTSLMLGM